MPSSWDSGENQGRTTRWLCSVLASAVCRLQGAGKKLREKTKTKTRGTKHIRQAGESAEGTQGEKILNAKLQNNTLSNIQILFNTVQPNEVHNPEFYTSIIQSRSQTRGERDIQKSRDHKTEQTEVSNSQRAGNPKQAPEADSRDPEAKQSLNTRKSESHSQQLRGAEAEKAGNTIQRKV